MRMILVRHGQTEWNKAGKFQGHSDIPMDETGREQVQAAAAYLAQEPLEAVYASDLSRAKETAAVIAAYHGLEPILDVRLRELYMGRWEGLDFNTVYRHFRQEYDAWFGKRDGVTPGGEGVKDVEARVLDFIFEVAPKHRGTVVAATHGGVIRAVLAWAVDERYLWEEPIDHASLTIIKVEGKQLIPEAINIVPWKK
ncbi:MAG TPA: histidine phosphatase family protein [Clostridia bacterium]|nr:histidine phosphatase family protein [Clostridia bacterium]